MQQAGRLQQIHEAFRDRADFHWIYVREAHAADGLRPAQHVSIAQPKTFAKRQQVAGACAAKVKLSVPVLVDDMEDTLARAYNALPDRLFILGADGKVAYRGARGPRGFDVDEMEKSLRALVGEPSAAPPKAKRGRSR